MKVFFPLFLLFLAGNCQAAEHAPGLEVKNITEGVYLHTSYKHIEGYGVLDSQGLIITRGTDAYLVDTPWSTQDTEDLLGWLDEHGLDLQASISTHWHDDRTAGIGLLNDRGVATYASTLTNRELQKRGLAKATHTFETTEFDLLENHIEVFYPGPGHSEDNLVVWLPKQKILFGGCLLRSLDWHSPGNLADANLDEWGNSILRLQHNYRDIHMVIPGHGEAGGDDLLRHTLFVVNSALRTR